MGNLKRILKFIFAFGTGKELLLKFFELLLGYPLYALSFITPRLKNKWVFGTNVGFIDNAKYLYLYMLENKKEIACIWISPDKVLVSQMREKGFKAYTKNSFLGLFHCLTAKFYVFTYHSKDINFFTSGRAEKINLWHGVGIKSGSGGKDNNSVNTSNGGWLMKILTPYWYERNSLFLSTSSLMNKHFTEMFSLQAGELYEGMYPRCSFIRQSVEKIETTIAKYESQEVLHTIEQLKQFEKVFLYMPTWRGNFKDDFIKDAGIDFKLLNKLMQEKNFLFVLKLHPAVKFSGGNVDNFSNIAILDKKMDIYSILPFTHTLITDYSSIYYDYLLMPNKEAILFPFDLDEYKEKSNQLAFDYSTYTPGVRVDSFEQLLLCIEQNMDCSVKEEKRILKLFWGDYEEKSVDMLINKILSL